MAKGLCMIHYTCDLCGQPVGEDRYSVNIEVVSADEDPDPAYEVDQLESLEDELGGSVKPQQNNQSQHMHFDLCPKCCKRFCDSPLPVSHLPRMKFSEN